jgi:F-type H+-transporting ATPase subunit b
MPQISQISEIFASQLFWLVLTFGLIYLVVGLGMVPKIEATVDARDRRISDDLAEAERARARADEIEEQYRQRSEAGRAEALKVTQAARDASARENERKLAEADAANAARIAEAEARIAAASRSAMAEIESVAADAAQQLTQRLAGIDVPAEAAQAAVKAELEHV